MLKEKSIFRYSLINSIRYTDAQGKINISVFVDNLEVAILFEDTAPGVDTSDLAHIFDRLFRVENTKLRSKSGSGLGLSIVKSIINAHEGTVSAGHSRLGGLSVMVKLPRITT